MSKGKIPLPWVEENRRAEEVRFKKAKQFWELSRAWNGFSDEITVHAAITRANKIMEGLDPNCIIYKQAEKLQANLVAFGSKSAHQRYLKHSKAILVDAKMIII